MKPTLRKPLGVLLILAYLAVYVGLVASVGDAIGRLPALAQAPIYVILGLVWVLPLRPLVVWIETGRWSRPRR